MASIAIFSRPRIGYTTFEWLYKMTKYTTYHQLLTTLKLSLSFVILCFLSACSGVQTKHDTSMAENASSGSANKTQVIDPAAIKDYQQAVNLLSSGQLDQADQLLTKVVAKYPNLPAPLYNLGLIAETQKDNDTAIDYYNRAVSVDKNYYLAYNNLGILARSQGEFDQALEYYQNGLKAAPDNPELNYNMAVLNEIYLHDYQAAIKHYERYLSAFSEESDIQPDKNVKSWIRDLKRRAR